MADGGDDPSSSTPANADGAPILVIAKLIDTHAQATAVHSAHASTDPSAKPSVTSSGDSVCVHTRSGSMVRNESVECDSVYAAQHALTEMYTHTLTPMIAAVLEGVNALVFVVGNDPLARRVVFDAMCGCAQPACTALLNQTPSPCDMGALGFAADTLMQSIDAKRTALAAAASASGSAANDVYTCDTYVSYCVCDDEGLYDMYSRGCMEAPRNAAPQPDLCVCEDDLESVYVRGLTTFGPVADTNTLLELLRAGTSTVAAMCEDSWVRGSAYGLSTGASPPSPTPARAAARRRASSCVRLTLTQSIRLPASPVNNLKSHLYIVDAGGFETLAPSYMGTGSNVSVLPTARTDGMEGPSINARGVQAIAHMIAHMRARVSAPFGLDTAAQFGLHDRVYEEVHAAKKAAKKASRSRVRRTGEDAPAVPDDVIASMGKDRAVEAGVLALVPALARDAAVSPYAVCPLTQMLADCLGGNCLTVVLCAMATVGPPTDVSLAVLEVVSTLRRGQCFPVVASTSARGLLCSYRRTIRHLRESLHTATDALVRAKNTLNGEAEMRTQTRGRSRAREEDDAPREAASRSRSRSHTRGRSRSRKREEVEEEQAPPQEEYGRRMPAPPPGVTSSRAPLAPVPEDVSVWTRMCEEYEARVLELTHMLLDSEVEVADLRAVMESDDALAHAHARAREAEMAADEARARVEVAEEAADAARTDVEDLNTELSAVRSSLSTRTRDLNTAKERVRALEQELQALKTSPSSTSSSSSQHVAPPAPSPVYDDTYPRRIAALVRVCAALRSRVATLTRDADEYARYSQPRDTVDETLILRDADALAGSSVSHMPSDAVTDDTGTPASYAALTSRVKAGDRVQTRMKRVLADAAAHIRTLTDKLAAARTHTHTLMENLNQAPGEGGSPGVAVGSSSSSDEVRRLKEQVSLLRTHLVRARDALVAARARSQTSSEEMAVRHDVSIMRESVDNLTRENARLRDELQFARERATTRAPAHTLAGELELCEKRLVEYMSENAALRAQVHALQVQMKRLAAKYERARGRAAAGDAGDGSGGAVEDSAAPPSPTAAQSRGVDRDRERERDRESDERWARARERDRERDAPYAVGTAHQSSYGQSYAAGGMRASGASMMSSGVGSSAPLRAAARMTF